MASKKSNRDSKGEARTKRQKSRGKQESLEPCRVCSKPTDQSCPVCLLIPYCNAVCYAKDWPVHVSTCKDTNEDKEVDKLTADLQKLHCQDENPLATYMASFPEGWQNVLAAVEDVKTRQKFVLVDAQDGKGEVEFLTLEQVTKLVGETLNMERIQTSFSSKIDQHVCLVLHKTVHSLVVGESARREFYYTRFLSIPEEQASRKDDNKTEAKANAKGRMDTS